MEESKGKTPAKNAVPEKPEPRKPRANKTGDKKTPAPGRRKAAEKKPEPTGPFNVFQKVSKVQMDIGYLKQEGQMDFKPQNGRPVQYDYVTESQITLAVRDAMGKHGIVAMPTSLEHKKEGDLTILKVLYEIINIDDPQDRFEVPVVGYGKDFGDKGYQKASTSAWKYFMLRAFAIPHGSDDIDHVSSEQMQENERGRQTPPGGPRAGELKKASELPLVTLSPEEIKTKALEDVQHPEIKFAGVCSVWKEIPKVMRGDADLRGTFYEKLTEKAKDGLGQLTTPDMLDRVWKLVPAEFKPDEADQSAAMEHELYRMFYEAQQELSAALDVEDNGKGK